MWRPEVGTSRVKGLVEGVEEGGLAVLLRERRDVKETLVSIDRFAI